MPACTLLPGSACEGSWLGAPSARYFIFVLRLLRLLLLGVVGLRKVKHSSATYKSDLRQVKHSSGTCKSDLRQVKHSSATWKRDLRHVKHS